MCSPRLLNPDPAAKKSNISNYFSEKLQIQIQVPIFSTGTGFSPFSSLIPYSFIKFILKQFLRRKNNRTSSSSSGSTGARISGKRFGCLNNGGKGCCFCLRQPQTLESNSGSRTSDPNDPNFTYDMLKAFIENNDFYSKECNPHFDFDLSSHATE
ncbi:hypothetical protein CFP56_019907 [Quercus suber]|uniref:Uncharacterized protein n=1 Tax=Quercus suber TaxID=58331 RepID=A0AAW0KGU8_QUESU